MAVDSGVANDQTVVDPVVLEAQERWEISNNCKRANSHTELRPKYPRPNARDTVPLSRSFHNSSDRQAGIVESHLHASSDPAFFVVHLHDLD